MSSTIKAMFWGKIMMRRVALIWVPLIADLPVQADYYLCGPMPFMAEQQKALIARGVPAENIHSEAFGTGGVHH